MSKSIKRLLSIMMAVVLLFGMMPVSAFATDAEPVEVTPIVDEPIVEEIVEEEPIVEEIVEEEPIVEEIVEEEPIVEEIVEEEPIVEEIVEEEPIVEEIVEEEPIVEEIVEEPSLADTYLQQINDLQVQANALGGNGPECADIYNSLMAINDKVVADKAAGTISEEEYGNIYNAIGGVVMTLYSYGFDPYAISLAAVPPNMGDYNAKNYVAYDVAKPNPGWWDDKGYNDTNGTYVASVTLGGVEVPQANSNGSNYGSTNSDRQGTRVGKTLSNFYPGLDTNSSDTNKTLTITPATGYYVTQVTIACCDGGAPYECGTWEDGLEFTQTFNVSTGGAVSLQLPSSAFGHGTGWYDDESPAGLEQYFILIKVAPVPEPLYVAYESGIMSGDAAFADPSKWVTASGSNNYGTGSNETPYTQFKYAYNEPAQVGNWKHITNTVTQEAKLAAAAKGYYFTGWKATYYVDCDDNYDFDWIYSQPADLIAENTELRLITHVKLVAQWAPVKLNVKKVVTGLSAEQDYTINVLKDDAAYQTVTFKGEGSKQYFPVPAGTYSVTETGANESVTIGGKTYLLTTTYSDPVALTAEQIVAGKTEATLTVTNAYVEATSVAVEKVWNDADNQDGVRPTSVTVNLLANGSQVDSVVLSEANDWEYTFEALDPSKTYTVTENAVAEYETTITGDVENGFVVTNKHTPEKISVSGSKTWDDANNQDGVRPASITIRLRADGTEIDSKTVSADDGWAWTFADLNKYANGTEIAYTITEDTVTGYTAAVSGYNITNTHTPETIDISGTKTWNDADNQDGMRPASITIKLMNGKKVVDTATVTEADGWAYSFTDLPKFEAGVQITYTIVEDAVAEYGTTYDGYNVINTHTPETLGLTVTKIWNDADDQDGVRPDSITVKLLASGETVTTVTLNEADGWKYEFAGLPKYKAGTELVYTVEEVAVEGYESSIEGFEITNTHEPEKTSVSGAKIWADSNDQDGIRPDEITIRLYADGEEIKSVTVTEEDDWMFSFSGLDKYRDQGTEIVYTITEDEVAEYTSEIDGFNVTNTYAPEITKVSGSKTWVDEDDRDGVRPESITINLLADGKILKTIEVTEADGWAWTFENLPKYRDGGVEIVYTITEDTVAEYTSEIDGFNVTNTYAPETTEISGSKTWVDEDDRDGVRPESITINLLADGEVVRTAVVTEEDNWAWIFTDLYKYRDGGVEIAYTIAEAEVSEYTTEIDGFNVTNTYAPEKIELSGSKTWIDEDDRDGVRPESITINLLADGEILETMEVTEADGWAWTFTNLYKYRDGGVEIVYTITEDEVAEYTTEIDGFNVTNTYAPEKIELSGSKTWIDEDDRDGVRPESITINLLADGEILETMEVTEADGWAWTFTNLYKYRDGGVEIVYTITEDEVAEYTTEIDGFNVTNIYAPEKIELSGSKTWVDEDDRDGVRPESITINLLADGKILKTIEVTEADGWAWVFDDLYKYRDGGVEIVYTITEDEVAEYTTEIEGFNVTNIYAPEKIELSGSKTWVDEDDRDGVRPESITINLLADGEVLDTIEVTEAEGWAWTFTDLYKFRDGGVEIVYTITEEAVEGYETAIDGFNVTNTHAPAQIEISGAKTWDDDDNRDGVRPESITINLLADGEILDTIKATEADGWAWTFTDLYKYRDGGVEIVYTITEETVDGYETVIEDFNVTNIHEIETIEVAGAKTWDDADDQDGKRPESITIRLLADGEELEVIEVTEADGWAWSFTELPKFRDQGTEIIYAITEDAVEGYTTTYDGYNVTNSYTPEEISVTVTKTWADSNDADGIRPGFVTIKLLANGEDTGMTLKLDAEGKWTGSFTGLAKYADGELIDYTVDEVAVEGYTTVIKGNMEEGFVVINNHVYIPQTGDDRNPMMWMSVMLVSGLMMALAAFDTKKRRAAK